MTAEDALTRLEALVTDERDAIQRLDSDAVLRAAHDKEIVLATLRDEPLPRDEATLERLSLVVGKLRHNGILLAHARDILRDAVAAAQSHVAPPQSPMNRLAVRPGLRISVTG